MAKCFEYEIIYDWRDRNGIFPDEKNARCSFDGTCEELQNFIENLRSCGGENIFFNCLGEVEDPFEEEYVDPWEREYIRSVAGGDYGSANPWDAPGMSVSDFI